MNATRQYTTPYITIKQMHQPDKVLSPFDFRQYVAEHTKPYTVEVLRKDIPVVVRAMPGTARYIDTKIPAYNLFNFQGEAAEMNIKYVVERKLSFFTVEECDGIEAGDILARRVPMTVFMLPSESHENRRLIRKAEALDDCVGREGYSYRIQYNSMIRYFELGQADVYEEDGYEEARAELMGYDLATEMEEYGLEDWEINIQLEKYADILNPVEGVY